MVAIYYASKKSAADLSKIYTENIWKGSVIIVLFIMYYFVGYAAVRQTSKKLMIFFISIMLMMLVIMCIVFLNAIADDRFKPTRIWLSSFVMVQILLSLATIWISVYICFWDFTNGFETIFRTDSGRRRINGERSDTGSTVGQERFDLD